MMILRQPREVDTSAGAESRRLRRAFMFVAAVSGVVGLLIGQVVHIPDRMLSPAGPPASTPGRAQSVAVSGSEPSALTVVGPATGTFEFAIADRPMSVIARVGTGVAELSLSAGSGVCGVRIPAQQFLVVGHTSVRWYAVLRGMHQVEVLSAIGANVRLPHAVSVSPLIERNGRAARSQPGLARSCEEIWNMMPRRDRG